MLSSPFPRMGNTLEEALRRAVDAARLGQSGGVIQATVAELDANEIATGGKAILSGSTDGSHSNE